MAQQRSRSRSEVRPSEALVLLVGFASWGAEALDRRLKGWAARSAAGAPPPGGLVDLGRVPIRARAVLVGLAVTLPARAAAAASRGRDSIAPAAETALRAVRPLLALPGLRRVVRAGEAWRERAGASLVALAAVGERESARGRRMAELGTREVLEQALAAVGQASQVREVLVEQSAGLAVEALEDVRRGASRADDRIEQAVRSFLPWRRPRAPRPRDGAAPPLDPGALTPGARGR